MKESIAVHSPVSRGLPRDLLQSLAPGPLGNNSVELWASLFQIRLPFMKAAILLLKFHVHVCVYQASAGLV